LRYDLDCGSLGAITLFESIVLTFLMYFSMVLRFQVVTTLLAVIISDKVSYDIWLDVFK